MFEKDFERCDFWPFYFGRSYFEVKDAVEYYRKRTFVEFRVLEFDLIGSSGVYKFKFLFLLGL